MKIFKQLSIIIIFCVLGQLISWLIRYLLPAIFIPGALIGMILLFLALNFKIIKLDDVETVGEFFVNNMGFFFVPAAVSVMDYFDILQPIVFKVLAVCIISFFITFSLIALSVKLTLIIQEKIQAKKELKKQEEIKVGDINE